MDRARIGFGLAHSHPVGWSIGNFSELAPLSIFWASGTAAGWMEELLGTSHVT